MFGTVDLLIFVLGFIVEGLALPRCTSIFHVAIFLMLNGGFVRRTVTLRSEACQRLRFDPHRGLALP